TAFAAAAILLRLRWRGRVADLSTALGLGTLVSTALVLLQAKGWYYQRVPALGFGAAAGGCVVAGAISRLRSLSISTARAAASAAVLAFAMFACSLSGLEGRVHFVYPESYSPFLDFVQRYTKDGDRILVCSTAVQPAYPLLTRQNRMPGSRFLW